MGSIVIATAIGIEGALKQEDLSHDGAETTALKSQDGYSQQCMKDDMVQISLKGMRFCSGGRTSVPRS